MKRRLYLVQTNNRYGENVYLPYSVGLLWAYARTVPGVVEAWDMAGFLYLKEPIDKAVARLDAPDLVAISCYIWNWRWSLAFAVAVKERWPDCKVLVGGVQVQDESTSTLDENAQIDLAIYGEGEGAFADLLVELAKETPDLSGLGSLVWRDATGAAHVNRTRTYADIDKLRSPYLDGVFDCVLADGWKWQAAQETNRGCPYACTFCAWGASALDKVRPLAMDRVLAEVQWFAEHECDYIDNCDANFGILPRDAEIVDALVRSKTERGYPKRFRTSWAKNSNDKIFEMARRLHEAGMLKAVTLSMQSMDANVQGLIRRKNIKYDNLAGLMSRYHEAGIPTYTELIMGLPGETLATYMDGIDRVLNAGQHDGLFCYPAILLPNTEMAQPSHIAEHGIETIEMRAMLSHGTPEPNVPYESQWIVVGTSTMQREDWIEAYCYSWVVQAFHVCGLMQHVARSAHGMGAQYQWFYAHLMSWLRAHPDTVGGVEFARVGLLLDAVMTGGSWDLAEDRFGDISWPPEEYGFLRMISDADIFYEEMVPFVRSLPALPEQVDGMLTALAEQATLLARPEPGKEAEYAREAVWYGRKGAGAKKRAQVRQEK